nr:PREDICTED: trace amine-associated receptor 13c-like [Lepisosteus oculatus]
MKSTDLEINLLEYCFENMTLSCIKVVRSPAIKVILYCVFLLTVLITIFGNLVVIISISHFRQLHLPSNLLILSLATADFLLGLFVLPFSMIRTVESCWYMGSFFCKLHTSIDLLLCLASVFHVFFIAFYRYYAVCHPLHYTSKMTTQVTFRFIVVGWVFPTICSIAFISFHYQDKETENTGSKVGCEGSCILLFNEIFNFMDSLTFYVACLITLLMYARIFTIARKQANHISMEARTTYLEHNKIHFKGGNDRKAVKTLGIVVGCFLFCWLPFITDKTVDPYVNFDTPAVVYDSFIWLAYFNSTFNPFIYAFFFPWFRKALKIIATCKIFRPNSSRIQIYTE